MASRRWCRFAAIITFLLLFAVGCTDNTSSTGSSPGSRTTDELVYDRLRNAFQIADRGARRSEVLSLTRDFLIDIEARDVGDDAASTLLTDIAQTSRLLLNNPALVQRNESRVVVGFPDGLGLFLYDLTTQPETQPLELSPWTAGLSSIQVTWLPEAIGVLYYTTSVDGVMTAHFSQAELSRGEWRVGWFGDEDPDWWFNTRRATVLVAPDLQTLIVSGESEHNSPAFDERPGQPQRTFIVTWQKLPSGYVMVPQPDSDAERTSWLWSVAVPSPYATLVEFVERLRINDMFGAGKLVTEPSIVSDAFSFGLNFPENRFDVTSFEPTRITVQSIRGTFVVGFKPPDAGADRPWLITSLAPVGAAPPTP